VDKDSIFKIKSPKVTGRIFIKGTLKNSSPLALSDGRDEYSDADIYRDHVGKPMIPATSFVGSLKSKLEELVVDIKFNKAYQYIFGYPHDDHAIQSHMIFDDLKCISETIKTTIRDGVKIEHATNLAKDQGKYDYELLEPGHEFEVTGEITLRDIEDESNDISALLSSIAYILEKGELQVGSLTSFGFGQLEGSLEATKVLNGNDYFDFLSSKESNKYVTIEADGERLNLQPFLDINMCLQPTTPFFIGGGTPQTDADDASLRSNDHYVVTAKSLKGAVRHHSYRIANTVHGEKVADTLCNLIFGNRDEKKLSKSKFWTTDAVLKNTEDAKAQMQVKIDRFTGGAIDSALFSTEPVWPTGDTEVDVKWKLSKIHDNENQAAAGLLLLVVRDLMTELLAIGGNKAIGRGRFRGKSCNIHIGGNEFELSAEQDEIILTSGEEDRLNQYITAFLDYKTVTNE
jgi:CRISPR/Cas system CSM-associated protein Csm3 (group 7 of RAMP superfamily)